LFAWPYNLEASLENEARSHRNSHACAGSTRLRWSRFECNHNPCIDLGRSMHLLLPNC